MDGYQVKSLVHPTSRGGLVEATTNNFIQRAELTLEFEILIEL